jgi:hypothetical protein
VSQDLTVDDLGAALDRIEVVAADLNDDQIEQVGDWLEETLSAVKREQGNRRTARKASGGSTDG